MSKVIVGTVGGDLPNEDACKLYLKLMNVWSVKHETSQSYPINSKFSTLSPFFYLSNKIVWIHEDKPEKNKKWGTGSLQTSDDVYCISPRLWADSLYSCLDAVTWGHLSHVIGSSDLQIIVDAGTQFANIWPILHHKNL